MIWVLLFAYQIKHFLADYPLQGKYMLGKFAKFPDYIKPLLAHVGVHAAFTFLIALFLKPIGVALGLALFDATVHFVVDRIKASPDLLGQFKAITKNDYTEYLDTVNQMEWEIKQHSYSQETLAEAADFQARLNEIHVDFADRMRSNTLFWWSLGWDQMMHHLTHYFIIWSLLS